MTDRFDHTRFLASLDAGERARLTRTSNAPGLSHLALHLCAILFLALWVARGWPLWPAMLLPLGLCLAFLFTLEHECTHKTPFRTPWLNEIAGRAAGFLIGIPFYWFRSFHMAHHRFTNDPDRDPELAAPKPETPAALARYLTGLDYWRDKATTLFRLAFGRLDDPFLAPRQHGRVRAEARAMLAGYVALALATPILGSLLFWTWLLPLALGFPFLRLYLLAEHSRCPPVADMFDNTRTTLTTRAMRRLAWNMPYHAEHHAWPQVPFHRLPEVHALAEPHLKHLDEGYSAFAVNHVKALSARP